MSTARHERACEPTISNSPVADPLVSIIIPTYNRRQLLVEAVECSLGQTYRNIEVLIVDDGSTDDTESFVAEKLRGEWKDCVQYHRKSNGGVCSARNLGVKVAGGQYIQFLDSDDLLMPRKIESQMAAIQRAGKAVDCCLSYGRFGFLSGGFEKARRIGEQHQNPGEYLARQCSHSLHVMHTSAPLWRRDFLAKRAGWAEELRVATEWEYYIRLMTFKPTIEFVDEDLFWVRCHEYEQLTKTFYSPKHWRSTYVAIRGVATLLKGTEWWQPEIRRGLLHRARTSYINLLRFGDREMIQEYEGWLLELARATPDRKVPAAVYCRRLIGTRLFQKVVGMLIR